MDTSDISISSENISAVAGLTGSRRRSYLGLEVVIKSGTPLGIIDANLRGFDMVGSRLVTSLNCHYLNSYDVSVISTNNLKGGQGGNVFPPFLLDRANGGRDLLSSLSLGCCAGVDGSPTDVSKGSSVARRAAIILDNINVIDSAKKSAANDSADVNFDNLSREDAVHYLQTSKKYLGMRTVADWSKLRRNLDRRKEWNKWRPTDTLLDLFTSVKYSHSSLLPEANRKGFTSVNVSDKGKIRVTKIARSHSIRLDPVDAPKELYKHRLRIDRIIDWAYKTNLVPVMMTLTVYHRWHNLEPLCRVLQKSWENLFSNCSQGLRRREHIDLRGFIRRMEETLNDNDTEFNNGNAGWHPHYHVILLIPKNKISTLSAYEKELRAAWVKLVRKNFLKEFGEEIPASYLPSLMEHGLVISRYSHGKDKGKIRKVKDSRYLAKIMGYDPTEVYGGDKEMTAYNLKNSKVPFDLLRGDVTANKVDLWCEYAIATKGIPSFSYSYRLEKQVTNYFKAHPEKVNPEYKGLFGSEGVELPKETVVAYISKEAYKFVYKVNRYQEMLEIAKLGYEALEAWLKTLEEKYCVHFGISIWKPREIDNEEESDDNGTSYVKVKVSDDSQNSSVDIDSETSEHNADAEVDLQTELRRAIAEDIDLDQAIQHGLVKVTYHTDPKTSTSSPPYQVENTSAQGTSIPISTEEKPASSTEPEKPPISAEELAIAERLDRPGKLPPEIKLKPLVLQGLSLTEALERVSLSPSQKELILGMIEYFRKEVSKKTQDTSKSDEYSSSAGNFKTQTDQKSENWSQLSDFSRLTDAAAIPESMKEEIRSWYTQHEREFRRS